MSADEIRRLADAPAVQFGGCYSPEEKHMICDALFAYAAMVERCGKLIAKYSTMPCEKCAEGEVEPDCPYYGEPYGCNSPTYRKFHDERISELNYILRGDAGKEDR